MSIHLKRWLPGARWLVILPPYVWMLMLFAVPFAIVLKISFAEQLIAMPPYSNLLAWADGKLTAQLNLSNYLELFTNDRYLSAYGSSLWIAGVSTFCCLLIGYPMAYAISRMQASTCNILIMLVILPSWTSFLIRIYAWIGILKSNGILNNALMGLGIIDQPLPILYTPLAAYIGIVYAYLPFMVLPLYSNLVKHDNRLLEAAYDLGASPAKAFVRITLPLSMAGIIAGCMLVFIPAVGEYVIPELLGGPDTKMIGKMLWDEYFSAKDWPRASAVAFMMLLILMVPIMIFHKLQARELESKLA